MNEDLTLDTTEREYTAGTYRVRVVADPDGHGNPREESDTHLGVMVATFPGYDLPREDGADGIGGESIAGVFAERHRDGTAYRVVARRLRMFHGARVTLPIYSAGGGGELRLSVGNLHDNGDGAIGLIYATAESLNQKGEGNLAKEQIVSNLRAEVEQYDTWANGEMTGYIIEREDSDDVWTEVEDGSCWGYYGVEEAMGQGTAEMDASAAYDLRQQVEKAHEEALAEAEIAELRRAELNGMGAAS